MTTETVNSRRVMIPRADGRLLNLAVPGLHSVMVDPELAFQWVSKNWTENRRLRPAQVSYLALEITEGRFLSNHPDAIIFDSNGTLINGQHRLGAIVEANQEVELRVETGADPSVFQYLDSGLVRNLEDRVKLHGSSSQNRLMVQIVNFFRKRMQSGRNGGSKVNKTSPEQAYEIYSLYRKGLNYVASVYRPIRGIARTQVLAAAVEMYENTPEKCKEFLETLLSPTGEGECQQARFLRDHVLRNMDKRGHSSMTSDRMTLYRQSVYCMKACIAGRKVGRISECDW